MEGRDRTAFLIALTTVAPQYTWHCEDDWIRATPPGPDPSVECCPITLLALAETGTWYAPMDWDVAAGVLGLDLSEACEIVAAADNEEPDLALRQALLTAVGL